MQRGVEAAGDAAEDDGVGVVLGDEVLRGGRGVDRAHAGGGAHDVEAVVLATDDLKTGLLADGAVLDGGIDLANLFFQGADDRDGWCHNAPRR